MFSEFSQSEINYISANRLSGTANDFNNVVDAISQWQGYEATPLYSLETLVLWIA